MPYKLDCNKDGCYVVNTETGVKKNKKRLPKERATKYMRALYHAEGGGESNKKEQEEIEMLSEFFNEFVFSGKEDDPVEKEKEPSQLMVFKGKDDEYRWIMFSSNAYRDRDGEIVSLKALQDDVERADRDGDYGPLRWWHVGLPAVGQKSSGPGLDIGDCDFNAMNGKILIESGTFRDKMIGEIVAEKATDLQGSILFFHPIDEPDKEGVFHNIHRAERSLLPRGKASNSLVSLLVNKKELEMDIKITKEKLTTFVDLVGEGKVKEALGLADLTEKEAEELGFDWKEKGEEPEEETPESESPEGEKPESEEDKFLGDMTPEKFQEIQEKGLKEYFEPLSVQLKGIGESQSHLLDAQASMKEVMESQAKQLKSVVEKVAELEGETPRSQTGYRPSQDEETVIEEDHSLKGQKPGMDPEFVNFVLPGNEAG